MDNEKPSESTEEEALEFTEEDLPLGELQNPEFQDARNPAHDPARQAKIRRDMAVFHPHLLERLTVWAHHGRYLVIDGGGRTWGMREVHSMPNDFPVPCRVFRSLTPEQALDLWYDLNWRRTNTTAIQLFRGRVLAGEEPEREINGMVIKFGMKIGKNKSDVSALGALRKAYDFEQLELLLGIATDAYGSQGGAYLSIIIVPLSSLLVRNRNKVIDRARLVGVLKSYGSPANLEAQGQKGASRSYSSTDRFIVEKYNKGLRGKARLTEPKAVRRPIRNV